MERRKPSKEFWWSLENNKTYLFCLCLCLPTNWTGFPVIYSGIIGFWNVSNKLAPCHLNWTNWIPPLLPETTSSPNNQPTNLLSILFSELYTLLCHSLIYLSIPFPIQLFNLQILYKTKTTENIQTFKHSMPISIHFHFHKRDNILGHQLNSIA